MIKVNDFVVLTAKVEDLDKNSVGFVEKVTSIKAKVFFIGKNKESYIDLSKIKFLDVTKTGDRFTKKICNICHKYIDKEMFAPNQKRMIDASIIRRPSCNDCRKQIDGVPLKLSEKRRMNEIKPEKFFVCPICKKSSIPYVTANLVIDHNHETGNARDWICDSCNTGLGRFKDNIELMNEAIKYLKKHSKN
ncbi:MAG: endonuclease VII domain-containing protein [Prevotellaceae bacterium]|jgi:hypothetical protein|nr:endonuclease VII domain-containing protein [Prevotellaceae bacterium]